MQSSDEDSDDMPVALSQRARQQSGRSHASRADGSNLSRAKTLNSHTPSNYQSNLARRNTEHQRAREAVTGTVEPSQNRSDSDNDGLRRGRSAIRATRNHATDVCLQALCNFTIIITQFLTNLFYTCTEIREKWTTRRPQRPVRLTQASAGCCSQSSKPNLH